MATNTPRLFLAMFLFIGISSVYAQSAGYFIETEGGEPRFVQRLVWSGGEYALRYEVVIENSVGGSYRNYHQEFTTALFINISLNPGNYRFRVIPYDILNRPGSASEWKYIEVLPALQPELFTVLPEYVTGAAGEESYGYLLNLTGYNIDPNAEIFIRRADGTQIAIEKIDSGDDIKVFLESDILISGEYEIVIRNPGGLESSITGIPLLLTEANRLWESSEEIEPKPEIKTNTGEEEPAKTVQVITSEPLKPVIFSVGLAYSPTFPIYGEDDNLRASTSSLGLTARVNLLFYIPIGVYIGPELSATLNYLNIFAGGDLLVRKWFIDDRIALSFRAGAEFGILPVWDEQVSIKMDISFLWRVTNNLLFEIGVDYSHIISKRSGYLINEHSGGYISPWVGIGWHF